jgi:hypothetical protein
MKCTKPECNGTIENGLCQICGSKPKDNDTAKHEATKEETIAAVRKVLQFKEISPTKEDLLKAADTLKTVVPYNFDAWRVHADLLLNALNQLRNRTLKPDPSFSILAIPLRENDLRDAAENALRQCAHFANIEENKIALVDEANKVRRLTWF